MSAPSTRTRALVALGAFVAAALVLRLVGLGHELPQHIDEDSLIVSQAESLRRMLDGEPPVRALEPHYPLLLAGALALWPPPADDARARSADPLAWHLERAALGHRRARLLVALIATLAVPLAWLIARRFVDGPWALLAPALVATSLLHLQLSQAARPHGALCTWIALGLWLDLRLLERGRWREHLAAAAAAALALGTLHTGASALLPLGAAQFVRWRRDGARALPRVLSAWALVALAGWLAYAPPGLPGDGAELSASGGIVNLSGHLFPGSVFDGGGFARLLPLLARTDPVLLALALAGLALALADWARGRGRPGVAVGVLCAWALPYLFAMGLYGRLPSRFLVPLVPVLALPAAWAVQRLGSAQRGRSRALLGPACALLLALPAWASLRLAWLRTRPEAAEVVARWLEEHANREHDLLLIDAIANPPLLMREEGGGRLFAASFQPWDAWLDSLPSGSVDGQAWRTRRLMARDPKTQRLRLDFDALMGVIAEPASEPVRRRFAVVAFDDREHASYRPWEAVLASGGRAVFRVPVVAGDLGDADRGPLRAPPRETLSTLLATRRLGRSTVVYDVPERAAGD